MPGPLDAEFATALIRRGMDPAAVLDAARRAEERGASLLGWLVEQRRLAPGEVESVLATTGGVPCPACRQPLPLAELWSRLDVVCPRCRAPISNDGVAPRIGALCSGDGVAHTLAAPGPPPALGLGVGQTFRGFELLQELGRGGMGVVFRARQRTPLREVALKVLLTRGTPEAQRARFRREIDALAGLGGEPGIVTIYEAGEDHGLLYFAMELVGGGSLADLVRDGPVDTERALQLCAETARALHVAHEAGVVHRDIKPANILLTPGGRPKVGDFGLVVGAGDERITQSGDVVGTPRYLAPEQLDADEVDRRCDVYALGAVLYELLSGSPPFAQTESLPQLHSAILSKQPPPLRSIAPDVPPAVEAVALRALAKDPDARYPDAQSLADALDRCRIGLQSDPGSTPRSLLVPGLVAAAVLAAGGLAAALVAGGREPAPRATPDPASTGEPPSPLPTPGPSSSRPGLPGPTPAPTATWPSPSPTASDRPMTRDERFVARLIKAAGALRGVDPRGGERLRVLLRAGQGELDRLAAQAPHLRGHPAAKLLEAWLGRFTRRDGGYEAATAALRGAQGEMRVLRALALEAHVVCSNAKLPARHAVIVADAEALLTDHPGHVPHPLFFAAANDAGSGHFRALGIKAFLRPAGLLPPTLKEPARAERYYGLLAAANRKNHFNNRPYSYARLAAVQLGRGDRDGAARTLDTMVERDPGYFFGYLLRGGLRFHRGELEAARADLGRARAWFRRYPNVLQEMQGYLSELEQALAKKG